MSVQLVPNGQVAAIAPLKVTPPPANSLVAWGGASNPVFVVGSAFIVPGNLTVQGTITSTQPIVAVDKELREYVKNVMAILDPSGPPPPPA